MSFEVFTALLNLLKGHSVPKKERSPHVIAAYRIKMKRIASYGTVLNPLTGLREERVLIEKNSGIGKKILLQKSELKPCIMSYYNKYKGLGARKLYNAISKVFIGVSEREIQTYLNSLQRNQRLHPHFINKPPLKPVTSDGVMDRIQMDLVDMQKNTVDINSRTYRYVLVVLDAFSRFLFLRALQSKSSTEIASTMLQLFSDIGPPKIVQSDQGNEFKGAVRRTMKAFKVHIICSRPYHPQSQGKVII